MARWTTLLSLISMLYVATSSAQSFNVTVDDQFGPSPRVGGVIEYSNGWTNMGFGLNGLGRGDPNVAGFEDTINGTWKKSVYTPSPVSGPPHSAHLVFRGTAVYVSCILNDNAMGIPAVSNMLFTIDGASLSPFTHPPLPTKPGIITTVFQKEDLTPGEHTLVIQNGLSSGGSSVIFLDAIIYTTDNKTLGISSSDKFGTATPSISSPPIAVSTSSQSETTTPISSTSEAGKLSTHQIAAIVGGVCGGVIGLLAVIIAFFAWRRRKGPSQFSGNFDRFRFVRWRMSRSPKAPSAQFVSSDMEAVRGSRLSNTSINSMYMLPTPHVPRDGPILYGHDRKY